MSPSPDIFSQDTICKVQHLESYPGKVVAMGTLEEAIKKMAKTLDSEPPMGDATEELPPKKKPHIEKGF